VREFLYVDDLAKVLLRLLDLEEIPQRLIVSPSVPTTVHELVSVLCHTCDFNAGKVEWDRSKPDGQHARPTDTSLLQRLLPDIEWTPLADGLKASYEWFAEHHNEARK
jgi:nucleoside-diphosphate-sugar epimerase